jgi:hypothetical protein
MLFERGSIFRYRNKNEKTFKGDSVLTRKGTLCLLDAGGGNNIAVDVCVAGKFGPHHRGLFHTWHFFLYQPTDLYRGRRKLFTVSLPELRVRGNAIYTVPLLVELIIRQQVVRESDQQQPTDMPIARPTILIVENSLLRVTLRTDVLRWLPNMIQLIKRFTNLSQIKCERSAILTYFPE